MRSQPPVAPSQPAARAACAPGLTPEVSVVESVPMPQRAARVLQALARGCPNVLNALADAAADAAKLPLPARRERLRTAAAAVLTPKCVDLASRCPQVAALGASPEAMRDASMDVVLFAAAVRQQLAVRGALDASAERLIETLLLASALEGEAAARAP